MNLKSDIFLMDLICIQIKGTVGFSLLSLLVSAIEKLECL